MKTMNVLSALFVSTTLLTTACTPRDVKVVDEGVRARILEKKNRSKSGYNGTDFKIGAYAMSAFLMEKQIEAIELVRLAAGYGDAVKTQYQVSNKSEAAVKIESTQDDLEYKNSNGAFKGKMTKTFEATVSKEAGDLKSLNIKGNDIKSSADSLDKSKNYLNLREDLYELTLANVAGNDAAVEINVAITGSINGSLGAKGQTSHFTATLVLKVDKASLATNDVKINSINATSEYEGSNAGKKFTTTIAGSNLALQADGLCNKLNGAAAITTDKSKKVVSFDGDVITIGDRWTNGLATCGKRPTVDLSRLLVY
ncbi:MAG: hypothetical protein ACM3MG_03605 [Bacillota bacterium]